MNKLEKHRVSRGTISEIIAALEKIQDLHGDLHVEYPKTGGRGPSSELVSVLTVHIEHHDYVEIS